MFETVIQVGLWIIVGILALSLIVGLTVFVFFIRVTRSISRMDHGYYGNDVLKGDK